MSPVLVSPRARPCAARRASTSGVRPVAGKKTLNISKAIKRPGALHKAMGVPAGQTIPKSKIAKAAAGGDSRVAKEARFAETLSKMRK